MRLILLGTGSAWGGPEHTCPCKICQAMARAGEERTRTSILIEAGERLLIDPGPDIRRQLIDNQVQRPDAVLISHEHLDHMGGLDELLCFRRAVPKADWRPLPVYAHPEAWPSILTRFGYLFGTTLEARKYRPGETSAGLVSRVTPFKTNHGPVAQGSVGLVVEHGGKKVVYTSDFVDLPLDPPLAKGADLLLLQGHYFNEPIFNRPNHMSLQNGLAYVRAWQPGRVVLVHLSSGDWVPGDPANNILKKLEPRQPLTDRAGQPLPVPLTTDDWAELAPQVFDLAGLAHIPVEPGRDGMVIRI